MHKPCPLLFHQFGAEDPLARLLPTNQVNYIRGYLSDLGATTVLEEQNYFDRDYLSEFSAFYGVSVAGYKNTCQRLHFFKSAVGRDELGAAAAGDKDAARALQHNYLGFTVIRPIPQAPFGRTVLMWYPDPTPNIPRIIEPCREYACHVAGITLSVNGLGWQQQDTGVGACATIGIWAMLHSSAFDESHAVPTTTEITRSAHKNASLGARMFPSDGLNILQIAEAIKDWNLCPIRIEGDLNKPGCDIGFSKEVFAAKCAAFIRSGYPVLLIGQVGTDGLHAICAVGIRSHGNPPTIVSTEIQDSWIEHIYVHDDNIGPNVRMKISTGPTNEAVLELSPPNATAARHALNLPPHVYGPFVPYQIVVAVHNDLRTSPDTLHKEALRVGNAIRIARQTILATLGGVIVSARFILLADYLERELLTILGGNPNFLRKARLDLVEQVRPMSLHLGVVRIGDENSNPIMDVLYDTTDSDRNHPVFANVGYSQIAIPIRLLLGKIIDLGQAIDAF